MPILRAIAAVTLVFALSSCDDDTGPPPFVLQLNSVDVVPTAVSRIELVLEPQDLDRHFQMVAEGTHAGGEILTRVSTAGEYVITIEQGYIDAHAVRPPSGAVFTLEVPLRGSEQADSTIRDPVLRTTFIRGTQRIASGERFLPWPLPSGGEAVATVTCIRPEFSLQCTNNDGVDAGPSPADSGVSPDGG